jgi:hypothetical protein
LTLPGNVTESGRVKRRRPAVLWSVAVVIAWVAILMTVLALQGKPLQMGSVVASGYVEPRSAEAYGFTHWIDQTSEGWVLRIGDAHWVLAFPF